MWQSATEDALVFATGADTPKTKSPLSPQRDSGNHD